MHTNDTAPASFWPDSWPAATPTSDQPGTLLEQCWVLFTYRHADDLPSGDRWGWCRYLCLPHVTDPPERTFSTKDTRS